MLAKNRPRIKLDYDFCKAKPERLESKLSDAGRILAMAALLCFGGLVRASTLDDAFNETLYSDGTPATAELIHVHQALTVYCEAVIGASNQESSACRLPGLLSKLIRQLRQRPTRTRWARSERLSPRLLTRSQALLSGTQYNREDLIERLAHLQDVEVLNELTANLRQLWAQPSWILTRTLHPELESPEWLQNRIDRFQAWIQSENPVGYLSRLSEFQSESLPIYRATTACLRSSEELRFALGNEVGILTTQRLLLKEVDVTRAAWGYVVPGLLKNSRPVGDVEAVVTKLQAGLMDTDQSRQGGELNECRALAWALESANMNKSQINGTRLACENARTHHEVLEWDLPGGDWALAQRAIVLSETQRERGSVPAIHQRYLASLFRDLQSAQDGECPSELKNKLQPLMEELRLFIENQTLED